MDDRGDRPDYLPPEAQGPEPDLSQQPTREQPQPGPQSPAPGQQSPGWAQQQQPQWGQQQGWQGQPPQPWAYAPQPAVPDNGQAVGGFTTALIGGVLLLMSAGLSSIVSVICSIFGIVYSKKGRDRVDRGETPKHRGLAQAGFIIGIVSLVLSVLATLGWGALLVAALTDEELQRELERELDSQQTISLLLIVARAALSLL